MLDNFKPCTFAKVKSETLFVINASVERGHTRSHIDGCQTTIREERLFQDFHARNSGVVSGNIYNYFTNKDELFREVVRPVLCALEAMLQEHHGIRGEDIMMMRSEKYLKSCIDEYVSLIDKHRALMEILLFRAQGSSLERFRENYTDRSTELVKAWFASMQRKHPEINTSVSDFIIHLHTVWMFTMFEELLMHSVPRQEMEAILHDYILFEIQGWRAIIKI